MLKLISWNVNGIRACVKKGFIEFFNEIDADIFAVQETKLQQNQIELDFKGYYQYWNYAQKKGYSGTAIFTKIEPISVSHGIGIQEHDTEGRVITLEYNNFYFVTVYTPNSQRELTRLSYRVKWETDFRQYIINLSHKKPVIFCGDMNVAHNEIDLKNPKPNVGNAGFTNEERQEFNNLLNAGFIDSYRYVYPDKAEQYTWWSYMNKARQRNVGWRIDYFILSESLKDTIIDAKIYPDILGSDHCPVGLDISEL